MSFNINNIKSALQFGGARPSLFNIVMQLPSNLEIASKDAFARKISFLCHAASLPASTISSIPIGYQGRKVNVAGNRTYQPWEITILNDEDFVLRNAFETWMEAINQSSANIRSFGASSSPESYKTDAIVKQFAKDNDTDAIKKVRVIGAFPTDVSAIELDWDSTDKIESFKVQLTYDLWETDNSAD